ncbi:MFS transporter [Phenylobacterium montanum]|uniref:MFS transporter n=1 Tax=Phenylobacterium montanum TaxID=2823693 RepID=A0A975G3X2_9CAUL|nr:MFS transporter [Caulobacter sp. S6]QUD90680.1 MFS transporter [Caulobacter sp. S6]
MQKPRLRFGQIWNLCFGFFGIQIGFGLQNANTSRIFQTLGADVDKLAILWIAAPLTGMLVQPIIGHMSDKTWGPLGRRRPYFLAGALLSTAALLFMPSAPVLWLAAGTLWVMDASINVTMEPFRAFVGDLLPEEQRTTGFATQSFFIGAGAVFASALPWMLSHWLHVANTAPAGVTPPSVRIAYYVGGVCLLLAVLWTIASSKEYSPEEAARFASPVDPTAVHAARRSPSFYLKGGGLCLALGALVTLAVRAFALGKEVYVLGGLIALFGLAQLAAGSLRAAGRGAGGLTEVVDDLFAMPKVMRQLAVVQFFTWFGLFAMWIYTTAAVTSFHYGVHDTASKAYNEGADWVGVLFAVYNGVGALSAFALPALAARIGRRQAHALALTLGALGLASFMLIRDPQMLWAPMIGVGIAWASILSAPYSILSGAAPAAKMGVYMGIFNIFIVTPQLLAATLLGLMLKTFFAGQPIWALAVGGASLGLAALAVLAVADDADPARAKRAVA